MATPIPTNAPTPAAPGAATPAPEPAELRARLTAALERSRAAWRLDPVPSLAARRADLDALRRFLLDNRADITAAVNADYGCRAPEVTLFADVVPVLQGIRHTGKHLRRWMRPQRRPVDPTLFPLARNRVIPQPLGVVGVIVPWNFPVFLSLLPLVSILAAGNRAILKMSEHSRALARLYLERLPRYLPPEKVAVFDETGGVGIELAKLPFDHLLFTGSTETGRSVMAAAAANLCPVTLELGGKSPALLAPDFPLATAVPRILFGKLLNAGQICTAVDYLLLPRGQVERFIARAREQARRMYADISSPDYTSLIDERALARLTTALDEARRRGAQVLPLLPGAPWDAASRKLAPHLVVDPPPDCALMQREIFGPVLVVLGYDTLDQAIERITSGPRPLAFYPFTRDRRLARQLVDRVMSGGVAVNDTLYQVAQHDLPFGGVGASGMGHYHGFDGFLNFSKLRPVFEQARISPMQLLWPPYGRLARLLLRLFTR